MRRTVLLLASVATALFLVYEAERGVTQEPPPAKRPNIVLFLTDDMAKDDLRYMPRTQELLVGGGMTFENAFVTYPLCCPTRATILRGQYAHNHRVLSNTAPGGAEPRFHSSGADLSTVATWLDSAGYETAHFGKYMNSYDEAGTGRMPPGWDEWQTLVGDRFDLNPRVNENGTVLEYGPEMPNWEDLFAPRAADFARRAQGPLYLQVSTHAPHGPNNYPDRYANLYSDVFPPKKPSYNEQDVSDKPDWVAKNPLISSAERRKITLQYRDRLRSLRAADDLVGEVVGALEEAGKLDNTYFFFTSDNGYHFGEHRQRGKWKPYEESIRVPLVVRGPGVSAGTSRQALVLDNDLAPTIADLAGVETPTFVDGRSLKPLLIGPSPKQWRTRFLVESWHDPGWPSSPPNYKAVRTRNTIYVRYSTGEQEFYDLRDDPYQLANSYGQQTPALRKKMADALRTLRSCTGDACRAAEGGAQTATPAF